jgi:hypothetical protein
MKRTCEFRSRKEQEEKLHKSRPGSGCNYTGKPTKVKEFQLKTSLPRQKRSYNYIKSLERPISRQNYVSIESDSKILNDYHLLAKDLNLGGNSISGSSRNILLNTSNTNKQTYESKNVYGNRSQNTTNTRDMMINISNPHSKIHDISTYSPVNISNLNESSKDIGILRKVKSSVHISKINPQQSHDERSISISKTKTSNKRIVNKSTSSNQNKIPISKQNMYKNKHFENKVIDYYEALNILHDDLQSLDI